MATDQKGLSLFEIIGAPLHALVEAETHAARATAEFIRDFGFEKVRSGAEEDAIDDFGKLRTVTFIQEKRERSGEVVQYRIEVPLLSLVPIPALQIKDAELEFYVKILETIRTKVRQSVEPEKKAGGEGVGGGEEEGQKEKPSSTKDTGSFFPASQRVEFKGALGRSYSGSEAKRSLDMQVRVKINVEQADVPAGLAKLFHLMDQGIAGVALKKKE